MPIYNFVDVADTSYFEFTKGTVTVNQPKTFRAKEATGGHVRIEQVGTRKPDLINSTPYTEIEVEGVVQASAAATVSELNKILFSKAGTSASPTYIADAQDYTGFAFPDLIAVDYDWATRKITLTGDLTYYFRGTKKELVSPWTSDAHDAVVNSWFLYSINGADFIWGNTPWSFGDIMVSFHSYKATQVETFAIREVHSLMQSVVHEELHNTIGTYLKSGGKLTAGTYTENSPLDADTTPSFDQAVVKDEDLESVIPLVLQGDYTIMSVGAANTSVFALAEAFPFLESGSFLKVNDVDAGALADGINNRYYNVYQILVPVAADAFSQEYRMIFLQPQKAFLTLEEATGEDVRGLNLGEFQALSPEFKIYSRITYITANGDANTGKCRVATGGVTYVEGTKQSQVNIGGVVGTNHPALSNLSWLLSGHYGTAGKIPAFDPITGLAIEITPPLKAHKTADQTKTSDTTLALDADMQVELEANSVYSVKIQIVHDAEVASGITIGFQVPINSTGHNTTDLDSTGAVTSDWSGINNLNGQSAVRIGHWLGYLITVDSGTFGVKWAQKTLSIENTTLKKGSWIELIKQN